MDHNDNSKAALLLAHNPEIVRDYLPGYDTLADAQEAFLEDKAAPCACGCSDWGLLADMDRAADGALVIEDHRADYEADQCAYHGDAAEHGTYWASGGSVVG